MRTNLSNAALASKMQPTTDMEKEVEMLLTAGGATEIGLADKEMEELKSKVANESDVPFSYFLCFFLEATLLVYFFVSKFELIRCGFVDLVSVLS